MDKALICIGIILFAAIILASIGYLCSNDLQVEDFDIALPNAPSFTVAHLSDLHYPQNAFSFGEILSKLRKIAPDFVALTGDVIDDSATESDLDALSEFFRALSDLSRCFLVIGNHEIGSKILDKFVLTASRNGITVLQNETETVKKDGKTLCFIGISDAYAYDEKIKGFDKAKQADVRILLAHRPEKFPEYVSSDRPPDVVFSGHAHGGLLRIGKTAFYAPNQGFFPQYTSGRYESGNSKMIVSRGLGVSGIDYRFFNKYHIPVAHVSC